MRGASELEVDEGLVLHRDEEDGQLGADAEKCGGGPVGEALPGGGENAAASEPVEEREDEKERVRRAKR